MIHPESVRVGDHLDHFGETWVVKKIQKRKANAKTGAPAAITGFDVAQLHRDSFGKVSEIRHRSLHPRDLAGYRLVVAGRDAKTSRSMTRRRSTVLYQSKPGKHGTLYRFRIKYRDRFDPASPDFDTTTWAYNQEHAEERFFDSDDDGWKIISIDKVRE